MLKLEADCVDSFSDILKRTNKTNPDYAKIETALAQLKNIMTHINEDKRKTEGQVVMFDIVNDIDNCPPYLLSSNRAFIMRIDGIELSDELSGRGDHVSLFLFSDSLEVRTFSHTAFNPYAAGG